MTAAMPGKGRDETSTSRRSTCKSDKEVMSNSFGVNEGESVRDGIHKGYQLVAPAPKSIQDLEQDDDEWSDIDDEDDVNFVEIRGRGRAETEDGWEHV